MIEILISRCLAANVRFPPSPHLFRQAPLLSPHDVGVDCCCLRRRVSHPFLDYMDRYAALSGMNTVDQAYSACLEAGLDRTKKTIRSWARNEHVEAQKQTTPTGERWMVEETSLSVKICSELEFQRQVQPPAEQVQTRVHPSEPVRTMDEPVPTRADAYEQERTEVKQAEQKQSKADNTELEDLRRGVRSLEIDKAVRDRQIDFLTEQNAEGQKNLLSQSRYIGHLETQVLQLGGAPDQAFVKAPVQQADSDAEVVNPHQEPLRPVQ